MPNESWFGVSDSWVLRYSDRPWTTNGERSLHYHQRAALVKTWRYAFFCLAHQAKIPLLEAIEVEATPYLIKRGRPQDVGSAHPAVKAAIDGLVDAGVIPDDSPTYLKAITFRAPVAATEDALELRIISV